MDTAQILQSLPALSLEDRYKIAEALLDLMLTERELLSREQRRLQMAMAAMSAIEDYFPGSELLAFTEIEGEDFYDYSDENLDAVDNHEQRRGLDCKT